MITGLKPIFERKLLKQGYDIVVGIDEAGRGPLAGPVGVAGFIFSNENSTKILKGVQDSKKLIRKKRALIYKRILEKKLEYISKISNAKKIDELGIGKTIEYNIKSIISEISQRYQQQRIYFLIDGYFACKFDCEYEFIKKGDAKFYSIAAASIIAKQERDAVMFEIAKKYPQYGFEKHVGYATKLHRINLKKYGPSDIHRKSFKPVADLL